MGDVRVPPTKAVFDLHLPRQDGKCQWCGKHVEDGAFNVHLRARWHEECLHDFKIIVWKDYARAQVWQRDRGICVECGKDASAHLGFRPGREECADGPCTSLIPIPGWHVEHTVPLWKVANMPPLQRLDYFRLGNLRTMCVECHERKTAQEHSERAHYNHLSGQKPKRAKRKMQSRGFNKSLSKGFDGRVRKRK